MKTSKEKHICIVGTGYVGMASAIGFATLGHRVTGYDIMPERVRDLQRGVTPYKEAGIAEQLGRQLQSGRLEFFERLEEAVAGADYAIVAVGTPARDDGSADMSFVESAVAAIAACAGPSTTIVLRSTVPAGTSERLAESCDNPFVYAPEFLREGSAVGDFLNPDRIVVGASTRESAGRYAALLDSLEKPVVTTSFRNAELIKAFSNAFLAMKVSFANEVASMCDGLDADAHAVLQGVGQDRRIGTSFLAPGIGFGGPCFEKDVKSLHHVAGNNGSGRELLEATLRVNRDQPRRIVDMLEQELGGLAGSRIAIWGLAFKAGTDDVRDSVALRIIDDLIERGAQLCAYDPAVKDEHSLIPCSIAQTALAALDGADALLVLTEWAEFRSIPPQALASRLRRGVVIDGRNVFDPDAIAAVGLRYRGVGRKPAAANRLAAVS
ncbi:MAG: UDP-glucose/GDP-mannose dehydrogenase family protein [Vulcanimicrobiaceae bacterium]